MTTIKEAADQFLAHRRIAVTGVSRAPQGHGGSIVYNRLRERRSFGSGNVSEAAAEYGRHRHDHRRGLPARARRLRPAAR